MNSWTIVKQAMIKNTRPGSLGRFAALNDAADLFTSLRGALKDLEASEAAINQDSELTEGLINRKAVKDARECGIIN